MVHIYTYIYISVDELLGWPPHFVSICWPTYIFYLFVKTNNYLAQKLCFLTGIIFTRVYVSVCPCVRLYIDYLKKFLTDFDETWQDDL